MNKKISSAYMYNFGIYNDTPIEQATKYNFPFSITLAKPVDWNQLK